MGSVVFLNLWPLGARRPGLVFLKKELSGLEKNSDAPAKKGGVGLLV